MGVLLPLLLGNSNCAHKPIPEWNGKIYAHDGAGNIVRKQAGEVISCESSEAKKQMAMTWNDFQSFYETYVLGCKEWKNGIKMMDAIESWTRLNAVISERHDSE